MKIEIWSDVVCPWCYLGKRRLEEALRQTGVDAEIEWRSFQLDPRAPLQTDKPLDEILSKKYRITRERACSVMDDMCKMAADEGLEFNFDKAQTGNTLDAHRVIHLAKRHHLGDAMKERLLQAYFTDGAAISDTGLLVQLAEEVGLDPEEVQTMLVSQDLVAEVQADQEAAYSHGATGVPFFLVNGKYPIPGAQPVDTFVKVLQRESNP